MRPLPPNVRLREDITTPRLVLEPAGPRHLDDLWESILSSHGELAPWMVWAVEPDKGRSAEFFEHCERSWMAESGGPWEFAILKDGRAIGGVGLHGVDDLQQRAQIGYWLRTDEAGRGLMTEAASAVVSFAFDAAGLHRIGLEAAPGNNASIRVAEKLGFQREGLQREAGRAASGWLDLWLFGLLHGDTRPSFHLQ